MIQHISVEIDNEALLALICRQERYQTTLAEEP